jgi:2-aminoethylphosphonate-pyruvate transaminase
LILLNPGPVTLTNRVRQALSREDLCHRESEFAELTLEIRRRIETVYPEAQGAYAAVLLTGSGTAAVESMLSTFASPHRHTLVASNGVYGERMMLMLERQRKPFVAIKAPWLAPINLEGIRLALNANPEIGAVAVVHHETTTGRLNNIDELAAMCREKNIAFLVDAVSSFGAEELRISDWQPQAIAATANKCLHGAPGVSFVLADREALSRNSSHSNSLYFDLQRYYFEQVHGWSPFTQAVHVCLALKEALMELVEEGGWPARRDRYRLISRRVREALHELGVEPMLPPEETSAILTAFRLPKEDSYDQIHDELKARRFVIYAGQGELRKTIFRIANMGAIVDDDLERLVSALQAVFRDLHW